MDYNVVFFHLDSGTHLTGLSANQQTWQTQMIPLKKRMRDRINKRKQINEYKGIKNKEQFDEILFWETLTLFFDEGFKNCAFCHSNTEFEVYKYARFDDFDISLDPTDTKKEWERFTKIKKQINDILSALRINGLSLSTDNFYKEIPSFLSDEVYNQEELRIFALFYCFSTDNSHNFKVQKANNRYHTKKSPSLCSYHDLAKYINFNKEYTTKERFFMSSFISSITTPYSDAKIKELIKYSYNLEFFSKKDFTFMQTFCPSLNPSDFDTVIQSMIKLQKKSTS